MTQREWDRVVGIGEVQPIGKETTFRERVKEDLIKNHVIKDNDKD